EEADPYRLLRAPERVAPGGEVMRTLTMVLVTSFTLLGATWATAQDQAALDAAYKREFAFLEAERSALEQRIRDLDARAAKTVAEAEEELATLQGKVMGAALEADRLADQLMQTETQAETAQEGGDVLAGMLTQAAAALERGGEKLPVAQEGETAVVEQVRFAFRKVVELLERQGSVRR